MSRERSQQNAGRATPSDASRPASGALYVVAVPIGDPDDLTLRALRVLRHVDLIASEDPAATRALLAHHGVDTPLTGYGPRNLKEKVAVLLHRLAQGSQIALVSDCGSAVIADPGSLLVASAHGQGIPVRSVPGPSAVTAALAVSGIAADSFSFLGSLPDSPPALRRSVSALLHATETTVAFCPAESLKKILGAAAELAPRRRLILACDLTTPRERIFHGTARQAREELARRPAPGLVTLMIAGRKTRGITQRRKSR
jgi:16S rRNA (cytidine1402-2'-O)-methyltransferase